MTEKMTTEKMMSNREFFKKVAELEGISEEITEKAKALYTKEVEKSNARKNSPEAKEKEERKENIYNFLVENPTTLFTAEEIGNALGIDKAKVTPSCTKLVDEGKITRERVKVDKNKPYGYKAV